MSDGPDRSGAARSGGDQPSSDADAHPDGASGRRARAVVVLTVALGVVTLYVAFGGPIPFVVEGGPSLGAVPAEADAVVYADAWTFNSESSQEVVDGLLETTNRSLPGYTGPASLGAATERLQDTRLNPESLRSVTAFGAYGPAGQPSDYSAVILRTGWETDALLAAFGGNADAYERRSHEGTTVYVHENQASQFAWVGVLGSDQYVLGSEEAVTDAIRTRADRAPGIGPELRERFAALTRGPVRFAATMPDSIPGDAIAPRSLTETVETIETLGGVYYPDADGATVELSISARDAGAARSLEPAVDEAIAFATEQVPDRTAELIEAATITRSGATLTVSLSGRTDAFVGGYRAVLETGLVRLLLGQPVGRPALEFVPADATLVAYGDAAIVVDATTLGFVDVLAGENEVGRTLATVIERTRNTTTLDVTALRSVTVFGRDGDAGAVVEANWNERALARTLESAGIDPDRRTVGDVPVLELTPAGQRVWLGILDGGHVAVGPPSAVADVIGVANGSRSVLGPPLRPAFERLPRGYATVVGYAPGNLPPIDDRLDPVLSDLDVVGWSYDTTPSRVSVRVDMQFKSGSTARTAGTTVEIARRLAISQVDNESLVALLEAATVSRKRTVVTGTVAAEPPEIAAAIEWLASLDLLDSALPALSVGSDVPDPPASVSIPDPPARETTRPWIVSALSPAPTSET